MSFTVRKERIKQVDGERKVIVFDTKDEKNRRTFGKITGSRFLAVLGKDEYQSEFKAACMIGRFYSEYEPSIYTEAGEAIEPIIRSYVREKMAERIAEELGTPDKKIDIEEPVDKNLCHYDHFSTEKVFGGMVDGYVKANRERVAVLEIKTSNSREKWFDENGNMTKVPEGYLLQASLYATLKGLDKIVFAVGFLNEADYVDPKGFVPDESNFGMMVIDRKDMSEEMKYAEEWFNRYIINGETPEWTERDAELVSRLTS